ncbi:DUF2637 domain-containing protein [Curtobacterium sp. MCSS17_016]|uniref:DUF2637 domain-containing protein n=1 Tax=Curtobacterium sp. MCSS17_016 TaxID=2175644 RepID=UPI000DA96F3B|nr:DUF2637 domain-containing protein [Curtobacterium sp. MCSS17_016]WIE81191.1 DUF2637 domain-containing protein [Curtobacterium sp. MCSS17_016]
MSVNGRILSANSPILLWLVAIAVMIVGLISFTLSFTALTGLATMARIPATVAWGWPLMVDGTIVVATFGTLVLRTRDRIATRGYPWAVLIVFGALSIYANGVHATGGRIGTTEAFVVGAVAPFALLTSTHLLVLMLTSPEKQTLDRDLREPVTTPATEPVPDAVATEETPATSTSVPDSTERAAARPMSLAPAPVPPAQPVRPARQSAPGKPKSEAQVQRLVLDFFAEQGRWPSGTVVGGWLGKSAKTGVRFVNKIREEHDPADSGQLA